MKERKNEALLTQITQLKAEEERRHPSKLEVDNTEAAQEEADYEEDEDEGPPNQNTTPAEESKGKAQKSHRKPGKMLDTDNIEKLRSNLPAKTKSLMTRQQD